VKTEEEIKEMEEFVSGCLARHCNELLEIHSRALACHCECLGMNTENAVAVCNNGVPPYKDIDYFSTTQKWGLTNEKGEPII
jgi:hypothetical protein